jgi:hypothetical protein
MEGLGSQRYYTTIVWGIAQGALGVWGEAITIQLVLWVFLGVRAVKGADADEVLFVG